MFKKWTRMFLKFASKNVVHGKMWRNLRQSMSIIKYICIGLWVTWCPYLWVKCLRKIKLSKIIFLSLLCTAIFFLLSVLLCIYSCDIILKWYGLPALASVEQNWWLPCWHSSYGKELFLSRRTSTWTHTGYQTSGTGITETQLLLNPSKLAFLN